MTIQLTSVLQITISFVRTVCETWTWNSKCHTFSYTSMKFCVICQVQLYSLNACVFRLLLSIEEILYSENCHKVLLDWHCPNFCIYEYGAQIFPNFINMNLSTCNASLFALYRPRSEKFINSLYTYTFSRKIWCAISAGICNISSKINCQCLIIIIRKFIFNVWLFTCCRKSTEL